MMSSKHKLTLTSELDGSVKVANDTTTIIIQPDGSVSISSYDPIRLVGAAAAKLDRANLTDAEMHRVENALEQRLEKKTSN
jgi:hypothetical protein